MTSATWDGESVELHPDDVRHRLGRSERGAELSTAEVVYVARHCAVVDHDLQTAGARRRRVDYTHTHIHSDAAYCYTRSVICVYVCLSTARHCAVVDHDLQTAGARRRRVDYTHTHIHSDAAYCYTRSVVCVYVDCTSTLTAMQWRPF